MSRKNRDLAIDLLHVSKKYRRVEALRGIGMRVGEGEIFGPPSPNGTIWVSHSRGKGTITVRTRREGDYVTIRVEDTGTAIAKT